MATTFSGSLASFSLADLLQWIEISGRSGRLTLRRRDLVRAVDVKDGAIVYVSSSRPRERLAIHLARTGVLPETKIYSLLVDNLIGGQTLSRLILDRDLVPRETLRSSVETLAVRLLLDLFHWPEGEFAFDPAFRTEDLLQIHLALRAQVMALLGAKSVDDSARHPAARAASEAVVEIWRRELLSPEAASVAFWEVLDATTDEAFGRGTLKAAFGAFRRFAASLGERLARPFRPLPIFDDTASMLRGALRDDAGADRFVQIAALDPFLTLDLLALANTLRAGPEDLYGTAREAASAIGDEALRLIVERLSDPGAPTLAANDRLERVIRRIAVSTAAAASHIATATGADGEDAYTLGLIEPVGAHDPLKLLIEADFPAGGLRAATLDRYRQIHGRALARKLNLPIYAEAVLASDGRITTASSSPEQLIFLAKQFVSSDQIGTEWTSDDPEMADRYAAVASDASLQQRIAQTTEGLFDILQL